MRALSLSPGHSYPPYTVSYLQVSYPVNPRIGDTQIGLVSQVPRTWVFGSKLLNMGYSAGFFLGAQAREVCFCARFCEIAAFLQCCFLSLLECTDLPVFVLGGSVGP